MRLVSKREIPREDLDQIPRVCEPCDQFASDTAECRAIAFSQRVFLTVFEDRRCKPREFLVQFLRGHLSRRYGPARADRAEDIASRIVVELFENPPPGALPSPDLIGLRRFLAARAVQRVVDDLRETTGRIRCGNCLHHQTLPDGHRR